MKITVIPFLLFSTIVLAQSPRPNEISFDFNQITCNTHADSLVGQEIYFFPRNQMFHAERPEKDTVLFGFVSDKKTSLLSIVPEPYRESVKKYDWTVLNVYTARVASLWGKDTFTNVYKPLLMQNDINNQFLVFSPYSAFEDKLFKIIACRDSALGDGSCMIKFTLQDPKGEVLHWGVSSQAVRTYTVCFKGFIQYLRSHLLNTKLYIRHTADVQPFYYNHLDGTINESVPGKAFGCTDITVFNVRNHIFPQLGLVLADTGDKPMLIDPGNYVIPDQPLTLTAFWSEKENNAYLKREKKIHDSLAVTRKKMDALFKAQPAKLAPLIKKYGKDTALYVAKKQIIKGMSREMCVDAWGNVHTTQTFYMRQEPTEVWGYSKYRWIRFNKDGRVIRVNE